MANEEPKPGGPSGASPDAEEKVPYPKVVLLILGTELCERFSYYGMRTVLSLYFVTILHLSEKNAKISYHMFCAIVYLTPIFGGYISDNWLGKFRTIFYVSLIYVSGQCLLSLTASSIGIPKPPMSVISLLLIAIGNGGIKPCVSAFGGDQFTLPQQEKHLDTFFFCFYFCINVGSVLSTFTTPLLRDTSCFGEDTCFTLAFGVPAGLMIIAIIIFVVGKPWYKIQRANGTHGLYKKCHHPKGEKVPHWLDRTSDRFDEQLITDVKECTAIITFFIPGIVFWSLYDQSGSTWTFQACRMNGIVGNVVILPDQLQLANSALILIMIPLFNFGIYPLLLKMNLLKKQLSRMCCGGFLLTIAFAMLSTLSLIVEKDDPVLPKAGVSHLRIYNSLGCTPTITSSVFDDVPTTIDSMDFTMAKINNANGEDTYAWMIENCDDLPEKQGNFSLEEKKSIGYYLSKKGMIRFEDDPSKDQIMSGHPKLRLLVDDPDAELDLIVRLADGSKAKLKNKDTGEKVTLSMDEIIQFTIQPGKIKIMDNDKELYVKQGGVYVVFIKTNNQTIEDLTMVEVTPSNRVHILWQIPQYVVYTAAEVMYSISALEFAYTQAPVTMKAFISAVQLISTFFGNIFTSCYMAIGMFTKDSSNNLFFTGLMLIVSIIFGFMVRRYTYVEIRNETSK